MCTNNKKKKKKLEKKKEFKKKKTHAEKKPQRTYQKINIHFENIKTSENNENA